MPNTEALQEQKTGAGTPRQRGPQHERLDVFVGTWDMTGRAYDSPFCHAADLSAVQTWEWLPGGVFLIHRLHGRLGQDEMACIEITGADADGDGYAMQTFYNNGTSQAWRLHERSGAWVVTGVWEKDGQRFDVRCTSTLGDGGRTMTGRWEYSRRGDAWATFWDTILKKR